MSFFKICSYSMIGLSFVSPCWAKGLKPKYGPSKEKPFATVLSARHEYFQNPKNPAPDFWGLIPHLRPQLAGPDCSVITLAMVLNAARRNFPLTSDEMLVTPKELTQKIKVEHWHERTYGKGYKKEFGIALDSLYKITQESFKKFGFPNAKVTLHQADNSLAYSEEVEKNLIRNESDENDYIIANFDQNTFIQDDGSYPHISPVAAYDKDARQVLILDVAGDWYQPYWVSLDVFIQGLNTKNIFNQSRGYIHIETLGSSKKSP